nr:MAG: hypothetical protein 1 [Leviviridae sp.]
MSPPRRQIGVQRIVSKKPDTYVFGVLSTVGTPYTYSIAGLEELSISSGHPWPPRETAKFQDIGGDFGVRRYVTKIRPAHASGWALNGAVEYRTQNQLLIPGNINAVNTIVSGLPAFPSESTLDAAGAQLWNRLKPTRPKGGIDQFVGELRELPRLPDLKELKHVADLFRRGAFIEGITKGSKASAGEYLNAQFGWLPFVKDIKDLCRNALNMEDNLRQLIRDNGRPVRRNGKIDLEDSHLSTTTSSFPGGYSVPSVQSPLHELPEVRTISVYTTYEARMAARFRYWIKDPEKSLIPSREKYQLNRILFGGEINAATLYHLMPWSWLLDWFTSTGAVVDNLVNDSVDSLVADYAYVTGHRKVRTETTITGKFKNGPPWSTFAQVISETKRRKHASPYGFGLTIPNLSAKRQAILVALGLTRLS